MKEFNCKYCGLSRGSLNGKRSHEVSCPKKAEFYFSKGFREGQERTGSYSDLAVNHIFVEFENKSK